MSDRFEVNCPRGYWRSLQFTGAVPAPRSGHTAELFKDRYMLVSGGYNNDACHDDLAIADLFDKVRPIKVLESPAV
jgi:hypothetical protein